jgi:hypothetical protein
MMLSAHDRHPTPCSLLAVPHMNLPSGPFIQKIERLEDELELARDRVRELEKALGIGDDIMPLRLLGLSAQEAVVVNLLTRRDVVTRDQILIAMYSEDEERRFDVQPKIVDVVCSKARQKLRPLGVSFGSIFKAGGGRDEGGAYRMPGPDKARLAKLVASNARCFVAGSSIKRKSRRHIRADNGQFRHAAE